CPTCTRPLGKNLPGVLEMLDEQLDTVRVDGGYYKDRLQQLSEVPDQVREAEEIRRTRIADVQALERRLAKIQAALHERETTARELSEREARLAEVQGELSSVPAGYDSARHAARRSEVERLMPLEQEAMRFAVLVERAPKLAAELTRLTESLVAAEARERELIQLHASIRLEDARFHELRGSMEARQA